MTEEYVLKASAKINSVRASVVDMSVDFEKLLRKIIREELSAHEMIKVEE